MELSQLSKLLNQAFKKGSGGRTSLLIFGGRPDDFSKYQPRVLKVLRNFPKLQSLALESVATVPPDVFRRVTSPGYRRNESENEDDWVDKFTEKHMALVALHVDLTSLNLSDNKFQNGALISLGSLDRLTSLNLSGTGIKELPDSKYVSNLVELDLSSGGILDLEPFQLRKMSKLQKLSLERNPIGDSALLALTSLSQLTDLNLERTRATDVAMAHLPSKNLRRLDLGYLEISDAGFFTLGEMPELRALKLSHCLWLTDNIFRKLADYLHLEELDLTGNSTIRGDGLSYRSSWESLTQVSIYSSGYRFRNRQAPAPPLLLALVVSAPNLEIVRGLRGNRGYINLKGKSLSDRIIAANDPDRPDPPSDVSTRPDPPSDASTRPDPSCDASDGKTEDPSKPSQAYPVPAGLENCGWYGW